MLIQLKAFCSALDIVRKIVDDVEGGRHSASDPDTEDECLQDDTGAIKDRSRFSPLICCDLVCRIMNVRSKSTTQ